MKTLNEFCKLNPKIYVACLAAYNAGFLHGVWILANQSAEAIEDEIKQMLLTSPIPSVKEYAIPDYLLCYIDYKAFARDLFTCDYFHVEKDGRLLVFRQI